MEQKNKASMRAATTMAAGQCSCIAFRGQAQGSTWWHVGVQGCLGSFEVVLSCAVKANLWSGVALGGCNTICVLSTCSSAEVFSYTLPSADEWAPCSQGKETGAGWPNWGTFTENTVQLRLQIPGGFSTFSSGDLCSDMSAFWLWINTKYICHERWHAGRLHFH